MRGLSRSSANSVTSNPAGAMGVLPFGQGMIVGGLATARVALGGGRINFSEGPVSTMCGLACSAAKREEKLTTKNTKVTKLEEKFTIIFIFVFYVLFVVKFCLLFFCGDPPDLAATVVGDQKRAVRRHGDSDGAPVGFVL